MEEKLKRIEDKVDHNREIERIERRYGRKKKKIRGLALISMILMFGAGFVLADILNPGPDMVVPQNQMNIGDEEFAVEVDGMDVVFLSHTHPDMEGRIGYVPKIGSNRMYLQAERGSVRALYETCVHEELHNKGITSMDHDYIYGVQGQIVSDRCLVVIHEYGKHLGGQKQ